jgi:BolA protein
MSTPDMNTRADRLRATLLHAFPGAEVTVRDDSGLHAGHSGARPGGETHYAVRIVAPGFTGMTRLARSRAVYAALADEFGGGMHALALELRAPGEV